MRNAGLFPRLMFAVFLFFVIFATIAVVSYVVNEKTLAKWLGQPQTPGIVYNLKSGQVYATLKGQGPKTIVFLTGLGVASAEWWSIQDTLSKDYQTLTYDRPGYTWSSPTKDYDSVSQARILFELFNELKINPAEGQIILVGHGFGANFAKILVDSFPSQFKGVVYITPLLSPSETQLPIDEEWKDQFIDQTKSLTRFERAGRMGFLRFLNMTPYDVPDVIQKIVLNNLANPITTTAVLNEYRDIIHTPQTLPSNEKTCLLLSAVIHHNPEKNIELMKNFGAPESTAKLIEDYWQKNSRSYLCATNDSLVIAKKGVFDIHIQEPELIADAIRRVAK